MDTIRLSFLRGRWPLKEVPNWKKTWAGTDWRSARGIHVRFAHEATGTRLLGDYRPRYVEASLPRLLHGDNALPITSQAELDEALNRLRRLVGELIFLPTFDRVVRLDLTWYVEATPAEVQRLVTRFPRHPWFRGLRGNRVERYATGFVLRGSAKRMLFYSKAAGDDLCRVEIGLRNPVLKKLCSITDDDRLNGLRHIDFARCYQVWGDSLKTFKGRGGKRLAALVPATPIPYTKTVAERGV